MPLKKVGIERFFEPSEQLEKCKIGDFKVEFVTPAVSWCGNDSSDVGVVYLMTANDVSRRRREIKML